MEIIKDIQHAKLIVDRIEYDGDYIYNVMQETDDIHINNVSSLIDIFGKEHNIYICNYRKGRTPEKIIYVIQFEDNSELPIGMELTVCPQVWRKAIPPCRLIKVEYRRASWVFIMEDDIVTGVADEDRFDLSVDIFGNVVYSETHYDETKGQTKFKIDKRKAERLLNDILRCVSREDCYEYATYGGIGQGFKLYFEDDTILEYKGALYIHGDVSSDDVINGFLQGQGIDYTKVVGYNN